MKKLTAPQFTEMLMAVSNAIMDNEQYLCKLDSYVGDGDHGVTVARGFTAVKAKLESIQDASISELLGLTGDTLSETMGGAIGPIFGSIFSAMGENTGSAEAIGTAEMATMLRAGLEDAMMIGGAQPGDRTLIDSLTPAVEAMESASAAGKTLPEALKLSAQAAAQGVEATKDMVAKKGRAKFLQEKSKGYQDAGATSMLLVLEAMAGYCAR